MHVNDPEFDARMKEFWMLRILAAEEERRVAVCRLVSHGVALLAFILSVLVRAGWVSIVLAGASWYLANQVAKSIYLRPWRARALADVRSRSHGTVAQG